RLPALVVADGRAPVPRTDVLADVAAEDARRQAVAPLFLYRTAHFDREIRQATRGVQLVGGDDGARATGVEAPRARAALIHTRQVGLKVKVRDDLPKEHPRPERRIDQAGVFPNPP